MFDRQAIGRGPSSAPPGRADRVVTVPRVPFASGELHPWLQPSAPLGPNNAPRTATVGAEQRAEHYNCWPRWGRSSIRPEGAGTGQPRAQRSGAGRAAPPWVEIVTSQRSPERAKQHATRTIERSENQRHDREGVLWPCSHKPPGFGATLPDGRVSEIHSCKSLCRPFRA